MSNVANIATTNEEKTLTPSQIEGIGKIGDAVNQLNDLIPAAQDALEKIRNQIDINELSDKMGPQVEALIKTFNQVIDFLNLHSIEDLQKATEKNLDHLEKAQIKETLPELFDLIGSLHESGLLKILTVLLKQIGSITNDIDADQFNNRISSLTSNLQYWLSTASSGGAVLSDWITAANLPEKMLVVEEIADRWWQIALRLQTLLRGESSDITSKIEAFLDEAEHWSDQLGIALGTMIDMFPALVGEESFGDALQTITSSVMEWVDIQQKVVKLVKGDASSLAMRVDQMISTVESTGLIEMLPELMKTVGIIHRIGLFPKVNMLLSAIEPMVPKDEELKNWLEQGTVLLKRYQPQISAALPALDATLKVMEGNEKKGGGIFGLLGIVFSRKTQYVLRFVIEYVYRFLTGNKA